MRTTSTLMATLSAVAFGADLPVRQVVLYKHGVGFFQRAGQLESEWRAWVVAARASRLKHDERAASEQLARAADVLSQFHQRLGDAVFSVYLARPDIQISHKQLGGEIPAADHQTKKEE